MKNPTKKQKLLLDYISHFIVENGYSPSYREIKNALSYGSVGTVANHVENLVTKGYLLKDDKAARSLQVVNVREDWAIGGKISEPASHKWLVDQIDAKFRFVEHNRERTQNDIDQLFVLVGALRVLGLDGAFRAFQARLKQIGLVVSKK